MISLLDNSVTSELRKNRPHGAVVLWKRSVPLHQLAIPGIEIAEIQDGIELTLKQDPAKTMDLESWLDEVISYYTVLPADGNIFGEWER